MTHDGTINIARLGSMLVAKFKKIVAILQEAK
jgi:hypothetical protein